MKPPIQPAPWHRVPAAVRIALIYALVSGLWIFASDHLLGLLVSEASQLTQLATYKGWAFVAITALMLYGLVQRALGSRTEIPVDTEGDSTPLVKKQTWPFLAFGILSALIVISGVIVVRFQKQAFLREEQTRLSTIAHFKAKQLDAWVERGAQPVEYAATKSYLARSAQEWLQGGRPPNEAKDRLRNRLKDLQAAGHYEFVILRDREGLAQMQTGTPSEDLDILSNARQATVSQRTLVTLEVHPDTRSLVHLFCPLVVADPEGPKVAGTIHVALNADREMIPDLESTLGDTPSTEVLLVGFKGGKSFFLNPRFRSAANPPQRELLAHLPRAGEPHAISGKTHMGSVAWSSFLPWGVLAAEDTEVVFRATQRLTGYVILLGAVFIVTGAVLVASWIRLQQNLFSHSQAHQSLERKVLEQRLDYLSRFANDIVLLMDETGRIIDANDRACSAYGYARSELLAMNLKDLRPPETHRELQQQWELAHQRGAVLFETLHRRRNGSQFPVEVSSRHVDVHGRTMVQSIIRDISDRKSAEEELKRVNRIQSLILENSAMGIALIREQVFQWVNTSLAVMLGSTPQQIQGLPIRNIYSDQSLLEGQDKVPLPAAPSEEWFERELRFSRLDGGTFWGRVIGKAVDPERTNAEAIWIFEDITARKESEEALRQAQKLESLGILAGGIAHDFNNLLTAIMGNLNLAQLKLAESHPAHVFLANVEKTILKAADLTRQMLAYSGKGSFVVKPNDLNQIVAEMTNLLEVSIPKKITLTLGLAPGLPMVLSDASQIQQVVMNLVTNAADAIGEEEGTISLVTRSEVLEDSHVMSAQPGEHLPPGLYAVLVVTDTGCGMGTEILARIFDPFFSTKLTGRGLGLSAMLGILRGHRAGIQIQSRPGQGSRFEIFFPATQSLPTERIAEPLSKGTLGLKARILLVDDEASIRETASVALSSLGLEVITAENGVEALERFQTQVFDLVVLDLTMPRMDGREAFRRLRELREDLPVIVCSGYSEQETILDLQGRTPTAFLSKPYPLKALIISVSEVLGARSINESHSST